MTNYADYHMRSLTQDEERPSKFADVTKKLKHITRHAHEGKDIKIENLIGFTQMPMGLAGPLQIYEHCQKRSFFCPLATIEAALVASVNRGCKSFQQCGGIRAYAMSESMEELQSLYSEPWTMTLRSTSDCRTSRTSCGGMRRRQADMPVFFDLHRISWVWKSMSCLSTLVAMRRVKTWLSLRRTKHARSWLPRL